MKPFQNTQEATSSSCDLDIIVEGKQYGAHWCILREKSTFFDEFYRRKKAKRKPIYNSDGKTCVHLEGVSSRLVGLFLQYVYTNSSKNEPFQLSLNEINDVLKFSIMFGLKDLQTLNSIDVEAKLKESQQMSQLHRNLLKYLYVRTTRYKTSDITKFVAHKAYIAADVESLSDVLEIVRQSDSEKLTMRLKLLDVLITLFTASLSEMKGLAERDTKMHHIDFVRGRAKKTPFLRSGLIKFTVSPYDLESGTERKVSFCQNSNTTNHIQKQQNKKRDNESKEMECPGKYNHNFLITRKAQNSYSTLGSIKQQKSCLKPSKATRQRSPANRRIALIKEHLERIDERFERENGQDEGVHEPSAAFKSHISQSQNVMCIAERQVENKIARADMPTIRVVKEVVRAGHNTSRADERVFGLRNEENVLSINEDQVMRAQGNNERAGLNGYVKNSTLAREYKEVSRDTTINTKEKRNNDMATNMNDRKPRFSLACEPKKTCSQAKFSYDQAPKIITRKIRKLWATDTQSTFPTVKPQNDNTNAYDINPTQNSETQETLNSEKAGQARTVSLNDEFEAISLNSIENKKQLTTGKEDNVHVSQSGSLNASLNPSETFPKENLEITYPNEVSSRTLKKIFLTGGVQKNKYFAHKAILELNLEIGSCARHGAMRTGRYNHGVAQLGNELYLVGGNSGFFEQLRSVESYSPQHAQWTTKPSMREARDEFSLVVCDCCLYAIGGHNGIQDLRSVEKFNAQEISWSFVSPMKNYRAGACAVAVDNRYIYVIGGFNGQTYLTTAEQYDVTADVWIEIQPISCKRAYSCAVLLERGIYIFGGFDGQTALSSCERFDVEAGTWDVIPDMNTPRMNATAVLYSGGLFILGGECDSVFLETVECYNMKYKTWSFVNRLPQPMAGLRACIFLEETETREK